MSALVRYFLRKGDQVAGYDLTPSPLIEALVQEGAQVHFEDSVSCIPRALPLSRYPSGLYPCCP